MVTPGQRGCLLSCLTEKLPVTFGGTEGEMVMMGRDSALWRGTEGVLGAGVAVKLATDGGDMLTVNDSWFWSLTSRTG